MMEGLNFGFDDVEDDPIKTASDQAEDKLKGVFSKLAKWRSMVVIAMMAIVTMVLPLITTGLVDPFSMEFWINAVYSLAIATLSYYIFAPIGMQSERLESATYAQTTTRWAELSNRVRLEGLIEAFYKFCVVRREEERWERKALFVEASGLPMSIYKERYEGLPPKCLRKKRKEGELTRRQVRYLKAANGEIRVLPINPSMILSGLKVGNINDVGREKRRSLFGLLRPMTLIGTMIVRGAIEISGNEDVVLVDYITQTVTNIFIIFMWSFTGFRYGMTMVRDEEKAVNGRSEFLSMFLERAKREGKGEANSAEIVTSVTE